jgi:hypothetical protein
VYDDRRDRVPMYVYRVRDVNEPTEIETVVVVTAADRDGDNNSVYPFSVPPAETRKSLDIFLFIIIIIIPRPLV